MAIKRLDHINVVVEDLPPAIAFFKALGLEIEGETPIKGDWVDRVNGLKGIKADIVLMHTPDGHGKVEMVKFHSPPLTPREPAIAPPNALGYQSIMFAVDNVNDTLANLQKEGGELMGEVVDYEGKYRLCFVRGPGGIIISLAEELFDEI